VDVERLSRLPGFAVFPYPEYSEVFFGTEYKVLRWRILGNAFRRHPQHVPQLGLPHSSSDLLRLPVRVDD
jgi:hypothetical protein